MAVGPASGSGFHFRSAQDAPGATYMWQRGSSTEQSTRNGAGFKSNCMHISTAPTILSLRCLELRWDPLGQLLLRKRLDANLGVLALVDLLDGRAVDEEAVRGARRAGLVRDANA